MSETNDICPNCKKPRSPNHTLVGFDTDGIPLVQCGRDAKLGVDLVLEAINRLMDSTDAASILTGIGKLWDGCDPKVAASLIQGVDAFMSRLEAAENNSSATGGKLEKKTSDHKEAVTQIAKLELVNSQQKRRIEGLEKDLATASVATADAIKEIEKDMGVELKTAQQNLERLDNECAEKLAFKEKRLTESEAEVAKLRGKIDEITASLVSALARTEAAEAQATDVEARAVHLEKVNQTLQKKGLNQALGNLELVDKIGELKGRNNELAKVCDENGVPVSEIVFEVVTEPAEAHVIEEMDDEIVRLDRIKERRPNGAAKEVPPPPPAASAAPALVVPEPMPMTPPPAPAPVAVVQTGPVCMCCETPTRATKVAKDTWQMKDGSYVEPLYSCKKLGAHVDELFQVLDTARDNLVNPPDDSSDLLSEFEDINPNS